MVEISFEFDARNTRIFIFGLLLVVSIGMIFAYGDYTNGNPRVVGHTADEMQVNVSGTLKTLQQAITDGDFSSSSSSSLSFSTGVEGNSINIGANRKCFAYTRYYTNDCKGDRFECNYDSATGMVNGAGDGCGGTAYCRWVCFD